MDGRPRLPSTRMTPCRPQVCSATDYPVAERLMYPLTDRRKVAIMQSCPGSGGDDMLFGQLKRREFITLLGSATAWPLAARAQQPAVPVIGFLNSAVAQAFTSWVAAYRRGLGEAGFVEAKNVAIEYRWAQRSLRSTTVDGCRSRQPAGRRHHSGWTACRERRQDSDVGNPHRFHHGRRSSARRTVLNLNRPGGNVTGVNLFLSNLSAKKLGLLRDLLPQATVIAGLLNSGKSERPRFRRRTCRRLAMQKRPADQIAHASNDQRDRS